MVKPALKPKLASVDELLFTTQAERDDLLRERVEDIPIETIDNFTDHPYQVRIDDEMRELVENIREQGQAAGEPKSQDCRHLAHTCGQ